jgi:hypothetical protein
MATRAKKMGIGTIAIGAFDWFARYQTGKDLIATVTTPHVASLATTWWVSPLVIGIGFLILFWDKLFTRTPDVGPPETPPPSSSATVKDSGNSTANAVGNKLEHHVHYHSPAEDIVKQKPERKPEKKPRSRPTIEFVKPRLVYAAPDEYGSLWTYARPNSQSRAVIAPLYYQPKSELRANLYARAHIVLKDADSDVRVVVPTAVWLEENLNHVVMSPGDEKSVLIFGFRPDIGRPVACCNETEYSGLYTSMSTLKFRDLSMADKRVELTLFWDDDQSSETYKFEINNLEQLKTIQQTGSQS